MQRNKFLPRFWPLALKFRVTNVRCLRKKSSVEYLKLLIGSLPFLSDVVCLSLYQLLFAFTLRCLYIWIWVSPLSFDILRTWHMLQTVTGPAFCQWQNLTARVSLLLLRQQTGWTFIGWYKTKVSLLLCEEICLWNYVRLSDWFLRQRKAINLETENVILFMTFYIPWVM